MVAADGNPARGAEVRLRSEAGLERTTKTTERGAFLFDDVPPDRYVLAASDETSASEVLGPVALAAGQQLEGLRLHLLPAAALTGTVLSARTREPITGATVRSGAASHAVTDHAGRFRLSPLPPTRTWVEATARGYEARLEWLQVDGAREHGGMQLFLRETNRVTGHVTRMGTPVAGARVWAERADLSSQTDVAGPVTSDAKGAFELDVPSGHFLLFASAVEGGARVQGPRVVVVEGAKPEEVQLELGQSLDARGVVLRDGAPVPGAALLLIDARTQRTVATSTTGGGGQFTFAGTTTGRYLVQVDDGQGSSQHGPFDLTGEESPLWEISLASGGAAIRGRVEPARAGLVVRARSSDWAGSVATEAITAADGTFVIDGLLAGTRHELEVTSDDASARVHATPPADVTLRLERSAIVGFAVDAEGRAVTDLYVRVVPESGGAPTVQPVLHPRGEFRISVPPGRYRVEATAPGGNETEAAATAEVPPGRDSSTVRLELAPSELLTGVVVDAQSGAPLAGAEITVHRRRDSQTMQFERARVVATGADGRFSLGSVGRHARLRVRAPQHRDAWLLARELAQRPDGRIPLAPLPENARPRPDAPQSYEGIGMYLRADQQRGGIFVDGVFDGGPAQAAGLLKNDQLLAVEGQPVEGLSVQQVVPRILGPAGTVVRLTLRRGDETFVLGVRRRAIEL